MKKRPQSFLYRGKTREMGVLLIHGFTGSTAELKPLGGFLHQQGFTVHAPLLKGHGLTPEEMQGSNWADWFGSVLEGYNRLIEEGCRHIIVVGLSMGGLLALKVAQYRPVMGIVTMCAPVKVRDKRMGMARYIQRVMPYTRRMRRKAEHIERELFIYDRTPLACVVSLEKLMKNVSRVLPHIHQPILVIQAEQDETVDPCSGELLYQRVGSADKHLVTFAESSHVITLDHEQDALHERIIRFIHRLETGVIA